MSEIMKQWFMGMSVLLTLSSLLIGVSFFGAALYLARVPSLPRVEGGTRGLRRSAALTFAPFAACDPVLRRLGGVVREVSARVRRSGGRGRRLVESWEAMTNRQLVFAGEPGGLDRHELFVISAFFACLSGALAVTLDGGSFVWMLPAAIVAGALPYFRLQSLANERFVEVAHELPAAIDLMALAMSAGADLPGALRRVTQGKQGVVAEELGFVLHSLDLGITRAAALLGLRDRLPVQEVRDLVRAVLMAEKKGASIADALVQQAKAGRQRRSVRAEESAARAGVLLLVPLMLLMACILLMMVGPLLCSEMGI